MRDGLSLGDCILAYQFPRCCGHRIARDHIMEMARWTRPYSNSDPVNLRIENEFKDDVEVSFKCTPLFFCPCMPVRSGYCYCYGKTCMSKLVLCWGRQVFYVGTTAKALSPVLQGTMAKLDVRSNNKPAALNTKTYHSHKFVVKLGPGSKSPGQVVKWVTVDAAKGRSQVLTISDRVEVIFEVQEKLAVDVFWVDHAGSEFHQGIHAPFPNLMRHLL